ncbi:hypothetical protein LEN26_008615 [Aphanomyces euteiches]|nr:hypothetical protein AeMF1_017334 [Aphanomyces euteiches]KAH9130331.1 hypothetical protein LEN26_008615 [Aphanomyces euteiches]KAH9197308.1 hypothetical protein AeNC1_000707 [Aphanomyces euteiches]
MLEVTTPAVAILVAVLGWLWLRSRPKYSVNGKLVVVTGAASGIGRGLSISLSNAGATVALIDVNEDGLNQVAATINRPAHVYVCPCDVADSAQVQATFEKLVKDTKRPVDVLINNAGIVQGKSLLELTPTEIQKTLHVNTLSHFYTTKAVLPSMLERKQGLIVSVSSVMGLIASAKLVDYCASKYAVIGYHEALRMEFYGSGVRTLLACPTAFSSGMFEGIFTGMVWWRRLIQKTLLPVYTVDDVVGTIMGAIQDGRYELITCAPCWRQYVLPWIIRVVRLLPPFIVDQILGLGGGFDGMNSFVGHAHEKSPAK